MRASAGVEPGRTKMSTNFHSKLWHKDGLAVGIAEAQLHALICWPHLFAHISGPTLHCES